jgi:hypothetical protein
MKKHLQTDRTSSSLCSDHTVGRTLQPTLNTYKPWVMLIGPLRATDCSLLAEE